MINNAILNNGRVEELLAQFEIEETVLDSFEKYKWQRYGRCEVALYDSEATSHGQLSRVFGLCALDHPENEAKDAEALLRRGEPEENNKAKTLKFIRPKGSKLKKLYIEDGFYRIYLVEFIYEDVRK